LTDLQCLGDVGEVDARLVHEATHALTRGANFGGRTSRVADRVAEHSLARRPTLACVLKLPVHGDRAAVHRTRRGAYARRDTSAEFARPARRKRELLTHRALFGLRSLVRLALCVARAFLLGLLGIARGLVDLALAVARLVAFGLETLRRFVFRRPRALSLCALRRPRALTFEACARPRRLGRSAL